MATALVFVVTVARHWVFTVFIHCFVFSLQILFDSETREWEGETVLATIIPNVKSHETLKQNHNAHMHLVLNGPKMQILP